MKEISALISKYGQYDFNNMPEVPHLGKIGMIEPLLASDMITRIFRTLPDDDYARSMEEFPVVELNYDDEFYMWKIAGNNHKTVELLDWEDINGAKPAKLGQNKTSWWMYFAEDFFRVNDYIEGNHPDLYQIQVKEIVPVNKNRYKVRVELDSDKPSLRSVPSSEMVIGGLWSKGFNFQSTQRSDKGTNAHWTTFATLKTRASLMRMEYDVSGNVIDIGSNKPLVFGLPDLINTESEKAFTGAFINWYDAIAMYLFRKYAAKAFWYSQKNYDTTTEQYYNFDAQSGFKIPAFAGVFSQIASSNVIPQSVINLDAIVDLAIDHQLAYNMKDTSLLRIETGRYGRTDIFEWIDQKAGTINNLWLGNGERVKKNNDFTGDGLTLMGTYTRFMYNGIMIETAHRPFYDDPERNKLIHATEGGLVSSRNMHIFDYMDRAKIKRLRVKNYGDGIFNFIPGMRNPFSRGLAPNTGSMGAIAHPGDWYSVHGMMHIGAVMENPLGALYMPFNYIP